MSNSKKKYEIRGKYITLWVWYKTNGNLQKIEVRRGELKRIHLMQLSWWVPPTEKELEQRKKQNPGVIYQLVAGRGSSKSIYQAYVNVWFSRFQEITDGLEPKFDGADGKALNSIIKYLNDVSENPEAALNTFDALLSNWNKLDEFYQKNLDLKFINSQLNKIIINLKDVTKEAAGHNAADLRQQL